MTDDLDKRLLNTFTRVWFSENTFSDKFCFYKGYSIPGKAKTVQDFLQQIETLPLVDSPEVRARSETKRKGCMSKQTDQQLEEAVVSQTP